MAYVTLADMQRELTVPIGAGTDLTDAIVNAWADEISATMDVEMEAAGATVPITEPPRLLLSLRRVAVLYLSARVMRKLGSAGGDDGNPEAIEGIGDRRLSRLIARAARAYNWQPQSAGVCE